MWGTKSHCNPLGVQPSCSLFNVRSQSTRVPVLPDSVGLHKLGRNSLAKKNLFSFPLSTNQQWTSIVVIKFWLLRFLIRSKKISDKIIKTSSKWHIKQAKKMLNRKIQRNGVWLFLKLRGMWYENSFLFLDYILYLFLHSPVPVSSYTAISKVFFCIV